MNYGFKTSGFTLAEALITLVIIGVIAALTIPAILVNTEQHEYKSALKKALSALNQVIELNLALEGYGPIEITACSSGQCMLEQTDSIYNFFRKRMNVMSTSNDYTGGNVSNVAFFTTDGMRYEFPTAPAITSAGASAFSTNNGACARPGEEIQDDSGEARSLPCLIVVDVNGERRPNPINMTAGTQYKVPAVPANVTSRTKILDVFSIIVTDINAYPYGRVAQRALFQHD